jgi:hypothetical protein
MVRLILIALAFTFVVLSIDVIGNIGNTVEQRGLALVATRMSETDLKEYILNEYKKNKTAHLSDTTELNDIELRYEYINTDSFIDVIARVKSESTCGTNGCITTLHIVDDTTFEPIQLRGFTYATNKLTVMESITNGMHDVKINDTITMTWNGNHYNVDN